ncbi:ferritin family protein [Candidatus Omnitrophota bacterium]
MGETFSACEVVELGIQVEENGKDFYLALSDKADDPKVVEVFKYLADAEEKHIAAFRTIFDSTCKYEPEGVYPDEYFSYMNSLASQYVFTQQGKGEEVAREVKSYLEGIDLGIKFEEESIAFYEGMKRIIPPESVDVIDKLIAEERKHLDILIELKEGARK